MEAWMRGPIGLAWLGCVLLAAPCPVAAQHLDVTVFAGSAFPVLDGRLVLRAPSVPSLPGVDVTASRTPELRTDGGPVFGGAVAVELGVLGIEGRLDATRVGFDAVGARYDLRSTGPPVPPLTGSVAIGDGRFDLRRLQLVSVNLRVRTPGFFGFMASGGVSYLPDIRITGSVPVDVQLVGLPVLPSLHPRLTLVATPDQSAHRWGVNGGAGIRVGGKLALIAEARIFYFRSYNLRFVMDDPLPFLNELVSSVDSIRFEPVILNGQVGLSYRF
jgi:hypothetical protein